MEKYNLDKIIKENLNKTKFQSKKQPSLHVKGWLDEYQGGGTYLSDKAKATQFGQYKKGGGYFPEYHSFAPPREADGGWLDQYQDGGYTVKTGDTLGAISKKTGVPVATLAKLNSIKDIDKIGVGQSLVLPGGGKKPATSALVPKVAAQPVQQKGVPFGVYAPNQPVQNSWPYTNKPAVKKTQPTKQSVPQTGTPLVYAPNQPVQGAWPYAAQQSKPAVKKTSKALPNKKVVDNSGMEAIRAFNATNNTIPYQENAQQAQLNPTKKKHTLKELRASIENIPSNWTFGLPMNVTNFIKNRVAPNANMSITNDNLSDEQKAILLQTIQRAQLRNKGSLSGGADYVDYPTTIGQSAQGFMNNPSSLPDYISTPEGQLATTLGGFTYNQDPETGEYIVTDKYNFSNARDDSRKGKEGKGLTGKLRKMADEDEAKNLAGQSDKYWGAGANRRVGIILNPKTMTNRKHGGWLDQYADGGDMITDPMGQWAHPGQNTRIPGNNITMQGVPYPVLAKANNGMTTMMYPEQEYSFPGASHVDEYPQMQNGGGLFSRTVTCSRCGHSWKGVTGGMDPLTCHKCGGLIKMKHGGWLDAHL